MLDVRLSAAKFISRICTANSNSMMAHLTTIDRHTMENKHIGENSTEQLHKRWIKRHSSTDIKKNETWWEVISSHYSEDQRHYHTLKHIYDMFKLFDDVEYVLQRPELVVDAIFFHDVIYDPKASDNEERSAILYEKFCKETNQPDDDCSTVKEWILLTKVHRTPAHTLKDSYGKEDFHYFLDMDMAVLGWETEDYFNYADQIRQEYIHIPDKDFNRGRPEVLRTFIQIANIFATRTFRDKYEAKARENIIEEIKRLGNID